MVLYNRQQNKWKYIGLKENWEWLSRERVGLKIQTLGNEYSIDLTREWTIRERCIMREEQCTHVWTLENAYIFSLRRTGTNKNTKTQKENLNIILIAKKVSRRRSCSLLWSTVTNGRFRVFCGFVLRVATIPVAKIPIESPPPFWLEEAERKMGPE